MEVIVKRSFSLLAAVAATVLGTSSYASTGATATAQQEIASVHYLVGTWNCAHTVGTFSGNYTTTYSNALGDLWLKQIYDFPAGQMQENGPPEHAEYFMGYDEAHQGWVRFGAMSTGQYFAIRMTDMGDGGWTWKYTSFFKRQKPETAGSDATFTKKSDSEYMVDGPTYEQNGTGPTVTEHHICKKV
jgi:hypothetical protein